MYETHIYIYRYSLVQQPNTRSMSIGRRRVTVLRTQVVVYTDRALTPRGYVVVITGVIECVKMLRSILVT